MLFLWKAGCSRTKVRKATRPIKLDEVLATVNRHGQFSLECRPWQQTLIDTIGQHAMMSPRTFYGIPVGRLHEPP